MFRYLDSSQIYIDTSDQVRLIRKVRKSAFLFIGFYKTNLSSLRDTLYSTKIDFLSVKDVFDCFFLGCLSNGLIISDFCIAWLFYIPTKILKFKWEILTGYFLFTWKMFCALVCMFSSQSSSGYPFLEIKHIVLHSYLQ